MDGTRASEEAPRPQDRRAGREGEAELKDILLAQHPERYLDDPHYSGYPAVLARLEAVDEAGLQRLLEEALRAQGK